MEKRITDYIEMAFSNAPNTRKSQELKEELIANMLEKYRDQVAQGLSEEEAYHSVIAGMGDISELVDGVRERQTLTMPTLQERRRSALLVALAVTLYILSPVAVIGFAAGLGAPIAGVSLMFVLIASATGLLVYNGASRPKYRKEEETFVEYFKEWQSDKSHNKGIRAMLTSAYWTLVVAVYLMWNFIWGAWAYSWILFIVAWAVLMIINAGVELWRNRK